MKKEVKEKKREHSTHHTRHSTTPLRPSHWHHLLHELEIHLEHATAAFEESRELEEQFASTHEQQTEILMEAYKLAVTDHQKYEKRIKHEDDKELIDEYVQEYSASKHFAEESYRLLKECFKEAYVRASGHAHREAIGKLKTFREETIELVAEYQKDTSKLEGFLKRIQEGFLLLGELDTLKPEEHAKSLSVTEDKAKERKDKDAIENYSITVDGAKVAINIKRGKVGMIYELVIPPIDEATNILLSEIRNELISLTTISMKELTDPEFFLAIKDRFMKDATKLIKAKLPRTKMEVEQFLVGRLMQDMLGLGEIEFLVADPNLEEIVIPSAKEPIRVYSKKHGWLSTSITIHKEEDIVNYSNIIARRVGKQITVLNPLLDAHLLSGDRINAVLYPINTKGNTITIRKFARDPYTIVDLINNKVCDIDIACLLWIAIEYEMNVIFSGGTASGKTSILNACMPFIPPNQRIISIEDTRELMLPDFLYWTPLVTRTANPEGKGEVSMLDLLINSLRMRPDRIILGEMRKKEEAMVLFEAMHTGHSVYATLHADAATETIARLVNPPLSIPPNLLKAVNLNVVMFRDRRRGIRRILQVAEFEAEKDVAKANIIYRWSSEEDKMIKHSESLRFLEDLGRNTGMSQAEINEDLAEKKRIIEWLIKHSIRALQDFGRVMHMYYTNKELLMSSIKKNDVEAVLS